MGKKRKIDIYTDGACSGNPGVGGWAVAITADSGGELPAQAPIVGNEEHTTNNRMELTAVIQAVKIAKNFIWDYCDGEDTTVVIHTDSSYVINGLYSWTKKWRCNGWKTNAGKPVLNKDLWEELLKEIKGMDLKVVKVKGHSGDKYNDLVDEAAVSAVAEVLNGSDDA